MFKQKFWLALSLFMVFALALSACGPGAVTETPAAGEATQPVGETPAVEATATTALAETPAAAEETPTTAAAEACAGIPAENQGLGGTVNVLGVWGGTELDNFNAMIAPFQECTGVTVEFEGTRDLNAVLTTRVQGGNPPDLAGLPGPGQLREFAQKGQLKPLNDVLDMTTLQSEYDQGWIDLATVNNQLYGIFTKASVKSQVWYNPKNFAAAGYTVPTTWDEMKTLEQKMVSDGHTPWCIGLESGAASGWPGTDWIEDFVLQNGGDVYDQWWQHQIPWTDPVISQAWQDWGAIVNDEKMVYGGKPYVLSTNFGEAPFPVYTDPPGCYMTHSADFITSFIQQQYPDLKPGEDFNFFRFPPMNPDAPIEVAGDLFGMFNDTPQSRALIQYLTTSQAQSIWASRGGFLSANKKVDPSVYPDDLTRAMAQMIAQAPAVRFDASDLMPEAVNNAFWSGILDFVSNPDRLDSILQQLESTAKDAYATATPSS